MSLRYEDSDRRNQFDYKGEQLEIGDRYEREWIKIWLQKGYKFQEASRDENIYQHWDYIIYNDKSRIITEVKGLKYFERGDKVPAYDHCCIELRGVRDLGWLFCSWAEVIGFGQLDHFIVTPRKRIVNFIDNSIGRPKRHSFANLQYEEVNSSSGAIFPKVFKRRKQYKVSEEYTDIITWLSLDTLKQLSTTIIKFV